MANQAKFIRTWPDDNAAAATASDWLRGMSVPTSDIPSAPSWNTTRTCDLLIFPKHHVLYPPCTHVYLFSTLLGYCNLVTEGRSGWCANRTTGDETDWVWCLALHNLRYHFPTSSTIPRSISILASDSYLHTLSNIISWYVNSFYPLSWRKKSPGW